MPVSADEFPLHQAPLSFARAASSDRNFYDRWYFNAHDRTGDVYLITGAGVYPNLGVRDAFALVRQGDKQWSLRCSDALEDRDTDFAVGPYRIEIQQPLQRIRLICDADQTHVDEGAAIGFDLTWEGSFPALDEQRHLMLSGKRPILDAQRFAQLGSWSGTLRVDGAEHVIEPEVWMGSRDRSWGIRPVGEAEPPGRAADEPLEGFWWLYVPLRFDDFAVVVICQEQPDGHRTLNDAGRVFADGRVEQLGWPEVEVRYQPGTRIPTGATIGLQPRNGPAVTLEVDSRGYIPLHIGGGYGGDQTWAHGSWRGRKWVEGAVHDLTDPAIAGFIPFGVIDHVGRARWDDGSGDTREGWGLFEHGTFGRHDPSGFADWGSVSP
ncbi:MAG: hypothetical protein IT195_00500 [Microthrixaceae bacterium]|nr:hypothetical protein [Microthrixaceae bacterium]